MTEHFFSASFSEARSRTPAARSLRCVAGVVDSVVPLAMAVWTQGYRILDGIFAPIGKASAMVYLEVRRPVCALERCQLPASFALPIGSHPDFRNDIRIPPECAGQHYYLLWLPACAGEPRSTFFRRRLQGILDGVVQILDDSLVTSRSADIR
uniref:hypothetical protein n=1 Tax=Burkholderia anthina TaxID=179879 RepID=UPI003C7A601D